MTLLLLVRHGETDWNLARRIQGSTDIPLNDTGRGQAAEAGERLAARLGAGTPVVVVASDLSRARETAEIIADAVGAAAPRLYPDLRERGYGEAEGFDIAQFHAAYGVGTGVGSQDVPGAEPWDVVRARAVRGLNAAQADARALADEPVLIAVAHGALIRQVIAAASDDELPRTGERLPNASVHEFEIDGDGLRLLSYDAVTL